LKKIILGLGPFLMLGLSVILVGGLLMRSLNTTTWQPADGSPQLAPSHTTGNLVAVESTGDTSDSGVSASNDQKPRIDGAA
jgi:hypothetical protein